MWALARRVVPYLRPYRTALAGALVLLLVSSACELFKPWPIKVVIDDVLRGAPAPGPLAGWSRAALLLGATVALVVVYVVLGGLTLVYSVTTIAIGQRMVNDLRRDLYDHLQRLSLAFHTRRQVGDLLYRVTADTFAIQSLAMNAFFPAVSALLLLGGMAAIMARVDWLLTALALAVCPALLVAISALNARISTAAMAARQQESGVYSVVQRAMSSMRVIQAFTMEEDEHRRFMTASREALAANLRLYTLQTVYSWLVNVVIAVGTAVVVFVGARHVLAGRLSIGEMVVFTAYLASLYTPVNTLLQTWGFVQASKAGVQRVFEILDVERDLPEGPRRFPPAGARGDVAWRSVSFAYAPGQEVLHAIDLRIRAGERLAIVGPTGAGKSTLVSLLPRFYDPQQGTVEIDGVDVREFTLPSLRRQIAVVLQPPLVFPTTVRENIAYGRPGATAAEVEAAARLAAAHDFVAALPRGYETVVGESGATISEGEKQRITIARALLRDAPILVLDEPTSSVDAETEALIMRGLDRLMAGRTSIIIAHRLSTVRRADRIVVLRHGVIVESGTFTELVARGGAFAALHRTQFGLESSGAHAAP